MGENLFLQKLALDLNSISGSVPQQLFQLHNLKYLLLANNRVSGEISNISNLNQLQYLNRFVASLENLVLIDLSYNKLTGFIPFNISKLNKLLYLDFGANCLIGSIPHSIGKLINLNVFSSKFSNSFTTI
jgi:hypothetical protein